MKTMSVPVWFQNSMFNAMICPCARSRDYTSYCDKCWDAVLKNGQKCKTCNAICQNERLYVDSKGENIGCYYCFSQPSFPFHVVPKSNK